MKSYEGFRTEMLRCLPEWSSEYEKSYDAEDGNYVIFGDFIIPKIETAVATGDGPLLSKAFAFFEEAATWDEASSALIHIEVGEWAVGYAKRNEVAVWFGPFVRDAISAIEDWNTDFIKKQTPNKTAENKNEC
jgi:hypothetical protein